MNWEDERRAFEKRLKDNWTDPTPIFFDNLTVEKPTTGAYGIFYITPGDSAQITLGFPARHRLVGVIVLKLLLRESEGTSKIRKLADTFSPIFRDADFSLGSSGRILCRSPSIGRLGVVDGWYQLNVTVPYQRDVTF